MQLAFHSFLPAAVQAGVFAVLGAAAGHVAKRVAHEYCCILDNGGGVDTSTLQDSLLRALRYPLKASPYIALEQTPTAEGAAPGMRRTRCMLHLVPPGLAAAAFWALHALHGLSLYTLLATMAGIMVLTLALIDARSGFLPDALTLPLLWLGLAAAWAGHGVSLDEAVGGAMLGYAFLWLILQSVRWIHGEQVLGRGDLKLLAALGAWVGWQPLPYVLLLACMGGALWAMWRQQTLWPTGSSAFGPFLAAGGAGVFLAGSEVHSWFW